MSDTATREQTKPVITDDGDHDRFAHYVRKSDIVRANVEGDMDLAGILGIEGDVRNGFRSIRVSFDIDADATADEIAALVAQSQKRSAVFDIVTNPTNVHVTVD